MSSTAHERRRSRGEIDRNYFFGDILIKTGVAVAFALAGVLIYAPSLVRNLYAERLNDYLVVLGAFAVLGIALFLAGRHLRRVATHWDLD